MHTEENKVLSLITLFRERSWWHNKEEKEIQTRKRRHGIAKCDKNENGQEGNWNKDEKMKGDIERQRDREGGTETAFKTKVSAER